LNSKLLEFSFDSPRKTNYTRKRLNYFGYVGNLQTICHSPQYVNGVHTLPKKE